MLLSKDISQMKTDLHTLLGLLRKLPDPTGLSQSPLGTPNPACVAWRKISAASEIFSPPSQRSAGLQQNGP